MRLNYGTFLNLYKILRKNPRFRCIEILKFDIPEKRGIITVSQLQRRCFSAGCNDGTVIGSRFSTTEYLAINIRELHSDDF